jgi:hypothetical protein
MISCEHTIWGAHRLPPFSIRQPDFEGATAVVVQLPRVKGPVKQSRDVAELNRASGSLRERARVRQWDTQMSALSGRPGA